MLWRESLHTLEITLLVAYSLIIQLKQHPVLFHAHSLMGTLSLSKMNSRKEKRGTFIWERKTIRRPSDSPPLTPLSHSLHFHLLQNSENLSNLWAARAEDTVVFSSWYFYLTPADLGFPTAFFKSFCIQAVLHFKKFLERMNRVQGRRLKLLILAIRQSSVLNSK